MTNMHGNITFTSNSNSIFVVHFYTELNFCFLIVHFFTFIANTNYNNNININNNNNNNNNDDKDDDSNKNSKFYCGLHHIHVWLGNLERLNLQILSGVFFE